jgi:hypothetical protein
MADNTILFDRLIYIDRLKRAGIADDQARAHADAMDEALRESVATKGDISRLEHKIAADISRLEHKIETVESKIEIAVRDLTIRAGAMAVVLFGALASIKFFGP